MTDKLQQRIFNELEGIPLIDPHTHIDPHAPASGTLADILGYHYYTELAHSSGLERAKIEQPELDPKEQVAHLVPKLVDIENTVQVSWLLEMGREFFDFQEDRITADNWEALYDQAAAKMREPDWEEQVLNKSNLQQVFLTNPFDDPLQGFDTSRYVPCLRTDDLVFHLDQADTRERLENAAGDSVGDANSLTNAIGRLFEHFTRHNARACAISLPPDFEPMAVNATAVNPIVRAVLSGNSVSDEETKTVSRFVFWTITEMCAEYKLPFDLMIGVNRRVYEGGVYQGQDLFDKRTSLIQYRNLFNAFPQVTFPISVLGHTSNQELVAYSWIFPNVMTNGHWWYSNVPAYIELDCRSRLQAVPANKQIAYYSDMYKLEFALPKFRMYRRVLAKVLAEDFVQSRNWSEDRAVALGRQVLRGNVDRLFPAR